MKFLKSINLIIVSLFFVSCQEEGGVSKTCVPEKEICDGLDNDCDGEVDENITKPCWEGKPVSNKSENSVCRDGIQVCVNGEWSRCAFQSKPGREECDGIDNDCDGEVDEREVKSCGPADETGICSFGDQICAQGENICINAILPEQEICDGLDNNCNGKIDEDLFKFCESECGEGIQECSSGIWSECSARTPTQEICDGIDNDCDGEVDEGCPCFSGEAKTCIDNITDESGNPVNCGIGTSICDEEGNWGECKFFEPTEEKCNNWDDDCDGEIDNFIQECGNPKLNNVGQCRSGERLCSNGTWTECENIVLPEREICDEIDNDCNGEVDDGLNPHNKVDMIFAIDVSVSMCSVINAVKQGISNYMISFSGTEHRFGLLTFPESEEYGQEVEYRVLTTPSLVKANDFQTTLNSLGCQSFGLEPSLDVAYDLSSPTDPIGINWRQDAYPYIIIITDEHAQTWRGITKSDVSSNTLNCDVGLCSPGDRFEIFLISNQVFYTMWDEIVFNERARFLHYLPAAIGRYEDIFNSIFTNVCL